MTCFNNFITGVLPYYDAAVRGVQPACAGCAGAVRHDTAGHHPQCHHLRLLQQGCAGKQMVAQQLLLEKIEVVCLKCY